LHVLFGELRDIRWFGAHLEVPVLASANIPSMILALAAAVAVFRFKAGMVPVLLASSAVGVVYFLVTGGV
jgi:chromate transporter